ncbi:sulfurtransferase [Nitratireductor sp. CAU 1489]|uniref:Sulfurtransferase n=1 Tax=Nitratireductor arenosus TaxID=2682096 RepID=A0A844QHT8_9HYPH|nr:chromate resistance protein ChrB domain-containing protein [Nitratireductor arenosus]MVA99486.1 sulfurtransferase [Nitratireductor arenosus]
MPRRFSCSDLIALTGTGAWPVVIDVRREQAYRESGRRIAGSIKRDAGDAAARLPALGASRRVVVYCAHGHNVSEIAAAALAVAGVEVAVLEGGFDAYVRAGGVTVANDVDGVDVSGRVSVWVTRERPKIDRIACPWLIRRFVDPQAVFHFVAAEWVGDVAGEIGAIPYDVADVPYSHRGERCTFDTMIAAFGLADAALDHLARIVRGADTAMLDLEPEAAGLLALSLGLSATEPDDLVQLEKGMIIYDALYGWCRHAAGETHNWPARMA